MKVTLYAIITIAIIHKINAHNHWRPNEDCLNGRIDARKCCNEATTTIYLKHPNYCDYYYKCSHRHFELKRCRHGQHWSVEHKRCKNARDAHCENNSELLEGCYNGSISVNECCKNNQMKYAQIPDQINCHKYYKCINGKSYHRNCPRHYKWSDSKRKCIYSSDLSCYDKSTTKTYEKTEIVTTEASKQFPNGCYDGSVSAKECCKIKIGKLANDISVESSIIEENFYFDQIRSNSYSSSSSEEKLFMSGFLPDPKNCHRYYKCLLGKPMHLYCPYHFKWNMKLRMCIYAFYNKCTDPEPTETSSEITTTTEVLTTTTESKITTEIIDITTPAPWRLPDGCYDGSIKAKECSKVEVNETMNENSSSSKEKKDISLASLIGENYDLVENRKHSSSKSSKEKYFNTESLADPKNCHKFFECKDGKAIHKSCPKNTKWNIELGQCVRSDNENCSDPEITTTEVITTTESITTTSTGVITTTEAEETTTIEVATTTTEKITSTTPAPWRLPDGCYDGSIKAKECCKVEVNETMNENSSSSKEKKDIPLASLIGENYDLIENRAHSSSKSSKEKYFNTESLADPKNCHKFFECKDGKAIHKSCPKNTKWNIDLGRCVHSDNEDCSESEITTTEVITTTESITTTEAVTTIPEETTTMEVATTTTEKITSTTLAPWRLPDGCYDGSIKAKECCKVEVNETMNENSSTSKEKKDIPLASLIGENYDLVENRGHSSSKSSKEKYFNTESLADPKNCHKYFECKDGKPVHKSCPKHTKWNIELGQCIYSDNDDCSESEITTTEAVTTTPKETTTTEAATSTTTEEITTTDAVTITTTEEITTTEAVSSTTTEEIKTTEAAPSTTTEEITTTEIMTTTQEPTTPEKTTSTESPTPTSTEEITTTEIMSTTQEPTTPEKTTSTEPPTPTSTEEMTTTEIMSTTQEPTTPEETTTAAAITTTTIVNTTITGTITTTQGPTTPEVANSTTTESVITTEVSTSSEETTSISSTTTTTDSTPDPNGNCGTASYKCRHGIISAEECCKGVPYWEDTLLQNNNNCNTYFQCVHEVPQIRNCPAGLYWNADICRCEWKESSTCNY